ncbi:MAG TPA: V-type ATPase 116kDa subunit family protein [Thermoplasmata archaeon]|nr:V-type ATPase 116kDa subunit family protein [Thermoplasmata archaeon]
MGILRPEKMAKVGLLGLREDEERILTLLHDLRLAQIEPLSPAALAELGPERATELQRTIADEALRFRGLLNALPVVGPPRPARYDTVDQLLAAARAVPIDTEVGDLKREDDRLQTELKGIDETLHLLDRMAFYPDRLEYLHSPHFLAFYGEASPEAYAALRAALPASADPQFVAGPVGESVPFLVVLRTSGGDALSRAAQTNGIRLTAVPARSGTVREEWALLGQRRTEILARRAAIMARLRAIADDWYTRVAAIDEALTIQNRKYEVTTRLGAGRDVFALEAWVPVRDLARLRAVVEQATEGRVHFYAVPTAEEPPTLMANPRGIRRFEFFIRFYSLPQADEWDPTLVFAIVFPLFFALMLGDWGYGLTILLICLWMIRGFPGAQHLPRFGRTFVKRIMGPQGMRQLAYALVPGCVLAIALGLYWDEFFGYGLFHALFGYHGPADIRSNPGFVGLLLLFAGFVGLGMVTLGFVFGLLKEYFHHHRRGVVGKAGGIMFAWGIAFFGLSVIHPVTLGPLTAAGASFASPLFDLYVGLLAAGLALLLLGEGFMAGMMSFIEVLSHILSYTRLVGILLASIILALVINMIGGGLVVGGTIVGIVAGVVILVVGQSFNVILGVFEPGIQGARLIFVEYFSKFYSGNGKPFRPFGAARTHTVSSIGPDGLASGPLVQAPPP